MIDDSICFLIIMFDYICMIPYTKENKHLLEDIAIKYEGPISNRSAYNFPLVYAKDYVINGKLFGIQLTPKHEYCISYCISHSSSNDIIHEVLHALYFKDDKYRKLVKLLYESLDKRQSQRVQNYLLSLGYPTYVIIDEFQAYYFTDTDFGLSKLNKMSIKNKERCIRYLNTKGIRC